MKQPSPFDDQEVLDSLRTDMTSAGDAKRRVASRLSSSIAAPASGAEPSPSDVVQMTNADGPGALASDALGISGVTPRTPGPGAARHWLAPLLQRPLAIALASLSIGGVCGAGLHAAILRVRLAPPGLVGGERGTQAPTAKEERAPWGVSPPALPEGETNAGDRDEPRRLEPQVAALAPSSSAMPVGSPGPGVHRSSGLAEQQALLDEARAALARGDNGATLRAVELHGRRYPDSVMAEEREALAIKAFVGKGGYAEARARGERFRERFPRSLLLPSIDETLKTIP